MRQSACETSCHAAPTVVRDARPEEIDASELVTDDVVLLNAGDRVSADLQVLEAHTLAVDNSLLTGESEPVIVQRGASLFAGTFVVEGEATAAVVATGRVRAWPRSRS